MTTKHEVLALHKKHPLWSSGAIAEVLNCEASYVRATLRRAGKSLAWRTIHTPVLKERERCAALAEQQGAFNLARQIRDQQ